MIIVDLPLPDAQTLVLQPKFLRLRSEAIRLRLGETIAPFRLAAGLLPTGFSLRLLGADLFLAHARIGHGSLSGVARPLSISMILAGAFGEFYRTSLTMSMGNIPRQG